MISLMRIPFVLSLMQYQNALRETAMLQCDIVYLSMFDHGVKLHGLIDKSRFDTCFFYIRNLAKALVFLVCLARKVLD